MFSDLNIMSGNWTGESSNSSGKESMQKKNRQGCKAFQRLAMTRKTTYRIRNKSEKNWSLCNVQNCSFQKGSSPASVNTDKKQMCVNETFNQRPRELKSSSNEFGIYCRRLMNNLGLGK